jgi:hypothetical protein
LEHDTEHEDYAPPPCPENLTSAGYAACWPRLCDFGDDTLDIVTAYSLEHVNANVTFVDLAQYVVDHDTEVIRNQSMQCFPAKGVNILFNDRVDRSISCITLT